MVLQYRWDSTDPLRPAAAGSSPPPPHSDGHCCKALLEETKKTNVSQNDRDTEGRMKGDRDTTQMMIKTQKINKYSAVFNFYLNYFWKAVTIIIIIIIMF